MPLQHEHEYLITGTHDEVNRQHYVSRLRMHILNQIGSGLKPIYEKKIEPLFEEKNGRKPKNEHEIRKLMLQNSYTKTWSTMMVSCQDMVWSSVVPAIENAQPKLNEKINSLTSQYGTLTLTPDLELPNYITSTDIHRMPGNYHTERTLKDATQGALYDRGRFIYNAGLSGPNADGIPRTMATYIKRRWQNFKPLRILELGCTIGSSTMPFVDAFPDAKVHAIDTSAPALRYGHARAESLGKSVHFHQLNAEETSFEDNQFDLIFSCIFFHETSRKAYPKILKECQRILSPSGLMMHAELPPTSNMSPFDAFYMNWDAYYNNEPFYQTYTNLKPEEWVTQAGFSKDNFFEVSIPDLDRSLPSDFQNAVLNPSVAKQKTARIGENARWYTYGAWN